MRIAFPNSAREAFSWTRPALRVGSAGDNDLIIGSGQGAAHHLRIVQDRRGWILQVLPGCSRVYVNARPVRERALLRAGDVLSVGDCRMQLCADADPGGREPAAPLAGLGRRTAALRAVAGPLSGRMLPLASPLRLGGGGSVPLEMPQGLGAQLALDWVDGHLRAEARQTPARYPLRVNGVAVSGAVLLHPGDQLGLGMHRFVVELPGLAPIASPVAGPPPAATPGGDEGRRGDVWWLMATAVLLALGIALVLFFRI